jgi:preprotein translocase subunit YajC
MRLERHKIGLSFLTAGLLSIPLLLSGCTQIGKEGPVEFNWVPVFMVVFLLGLAYFLIIRPARKRQKNAQKLLDTLKRGDRVIAGGIYGVIDTVSTDSVVIKVESGDKIRVSKQGLLIKRSPD